MNKVILLVLLTPLLVLPFKGFGQIIENFESGNISRWIQSPEGRWSVSTTGSISGIYSLHHSFDNPDAGNDIAGLPLENFHPGQGDASWSFKIRYGYDPSSSNNWVVYILSDFGPGIIQGSGVSNGYAVGVNQTGYDDTLRLWKVKAGLFVPVISSGINWQTMIGTESAVKIFVERSQQGDWKLRVFRADDSLMGEGTGKDPELSDPSWFAVGFKYTSTCDMLLWLDDIEIKGDFHYDTDPPDVIACKVSGRKSLLIEFDKQPSAESLVPGNFSADEGKNLACSTIQEAPSSLKIVFREDFVNKSINSLTINNLCDRSGNCRSNVGVEFTPVWADPGDVIFTEIMADPLPAVSLPGEEYLEILNRSGYSLQPDNWTIATAGQSYPFPEMTLNPGSYIIICREADTSSFSIYGPTMGFRSLPALTDSGREIAIMDSSGNLIHGIEYSSSWYGDELKSDGGWSLEIIDPAFPFYCKGNWKASSSREGGSPGSANSVYAQNTDNLFFGLENVFPEDSLLIRMKMSETVTGLSGKNKSIKIDGVEAKSITSEDLLLKEYTLVPSDPLRRHHIYVLEADAGVKDFAGNAMERNNFSFGIPEPALNGDVQFNELLFNPLPGDPDYIELINCSEKIIDVSKLLLVSVNDETADTSRPVNLSADGRCLVPGGFYVITADRNKLAERYSSSNTDNIFEIPSLPSMPDDKGHLLLLSRDLTLIDEVSYSEEMQYSLLQDAEGVALEKIRPGNLSTVKSYWQSASEASGWGTPGAPNSVFFEEPEDDDNVTLSSGRITPDNDGNEDFLVLDFRLKGNGKVVSVEIFNETGSFVKKIADNFMADHKASVVWDGTASDGKLVDTGIYILLIQVFDDRGEILKWKKVCTVIR